MSRPDPVPQREAMGMYEEQGAADVAAIGGYIVVQTPAYESMTVFGPQEGLDPTGWMVVGILWEKNMFITAPRDFDD